MLGLILGSWTVVRVNFTSLLELPSRTTIPQQGGRTLAAPVPTENIANGVKRNAALLSKTLTVPLRELKTRAFLVRPLSKIAITPPSDSTPQIAIADVQLELAPSQINLGNYRWMEPVALDPRKTLHFQGSFWLLARRGGLNTVGNPSLGASQLGGRALLPLATFRDDTTLLASVRASMPMQGRGDELGLGLAVKTRLIVPIEVIAERRIALSKAQKDRWSLIASSGFSDVKLGEKISAEGYGQAGIVGSKRAELFAGGAVAIHHALSNKPGLQTDFGISVWGDVQKGASRLDVGPEIRAKMAVGPTPVRVAVQWRFRVLGDAQPSSGPAVVLASDF
jgi:hypothetical protein